MLVKLPYRMIIAAVLALGILGTAGESYAKDASGGWDILGGTSCSEYLDSYSRSSLSVEGTYDGTPRFFGSIGWLNGFITAYNLNVQNGRRNVLYGITYNDTYRWAASWCRDNPSKDITTAVQALIRSRR